MVKTQALSLMPRAFRSVPFVELRHFLPSQLEVISPLVDQLMRFIARFRDLDGSELDIELAFREALANAIVHGNHEDPYKRVYVACRCTTDGEVSIMIRDEGDGFDRRTVPDPTASEDRVLTHGRGIYLMKTMMDDVRFEHGGTAVYMRKESNAGPGRTESKTPTHSVETRNTGLERTNDKSCKGTIRC